MVEGLPQKQKLRVMPKIRRQRHVNLEDKVVSSRGSYEPVND